MWAAAALASSSLNREWKDGDTVTLRLPMKVRRAHWAKNKNAVSVDYGPLSFSLAIKERWEKVRQPQRELAGVGSLRRIAVELRPRARREESGEVLRGRAQAGPLPAQPFTRDTVPVPQGQGPQDSRLADGPPGHGGRLQQSPARTVEPVEEITLIPMGAARLGSRPSRP